MPQEVEGLSGRALEQTDGLVLCGSDSTCAPWPGQAPGLVLTWDIQLPGAPTARGDWEQERSQFTYGSENKA